MAAKLNESLALGKLTIFNRTHGEVMLYYVDKETGKLQSLVIPPRCAKLDLLKYTDIDGWRKSTNLMQVINARRLGVIL